MGAALRPPSAAEGLRAVCQASLARPEDSRPPAERDPSCSQRDLDEICDRAAAALASSSRTLAALVLPGSFNPVHSEHLRSLELARDHLASSGATVVAAFLQPSSDEYVAGKVGTPWAMRLADRIAACELAARADASRRGGETWIYAWRSGQTNGFAVPRRVGALLSGAAAERLGGKLPRPIEAYMVCGADLVSRCGGWARPVSPPMIVVGRPGVALPPAPPAKGWHLAEGDTRPASSTEIRGAIGGGHWDHLAELGCEASVVAFLRARREAGELFMAGE